jgi:hypothetical protein
MDYTIRDEALLKKLNQIKNWKKKKYIRKEIMNYFKKHNITFTFAFGAGIDLYYYGFCGCLWTEAYHFPTENQLIIQCDEKYYAKNCGLFTFNMV